MLMGIAAGATAGAVIGFVVGVYRKVFKKDKKMMEYDKKKAESLRRNAKLITSATYLVLVVGIIWTLYCLILALIDRSQVEYATNISQLIVSVLTVFSIFMAFYQLLRGK